MQRFDEIPSRKKSTSQTKPIESQSQNLNAANDKQSTNIKQIKENFEERIKTLWKKTNTQPTVLRIRLIEEHWGSKRQKNMGKETHQQPEKTASREHQQIAGKNTPK